MSSNPFPVDDTSINAIVDLMSDTGLDSIWLDLDGDQVPETMVQVDGPFSADDDLPDLDDATVTGDDLVGEPIATLLPWESDAGSTDVWALPSDDWTDMDCYDPMAVPSDWTVDGSGESGDGYDIPIDGTDAPFAVDDTGGFSDAGGYYDTSGYTDTTGYFDTTAYDGGGGYDADTVDSTGYDDPTLTTEVTTEVTDDWDSGIAAAESQPWTDYSGDLADTSTDLYHQSMDAWAVGDTAGSEQLYDMSMDAWSDSGDAWDYSTEVYNDPTGWTESTSYETYDTSSGAVYDSGYDSTSYTYDSASTDTASYDSSSDW